MPNAQNALRHEQWDVCDVCGFQYPMSQLTTQKGRLVCTRRCVDDLTVERRDAVIAKMLAVAVDQEGADLRQVDRAFFDPGSEEGVF